MFKVLFRITYGLFVALGVILTYNYTDSNIKKAYINEIGLEAISNNEYDVFMPFRYYNINPLYDETITIEEKDIKVLVYEVVYVNIINDEIVIDEGIFFLMHQLDGEPLNKYLSVSILNGEHRKNEYLGIRVEKLPLHIAILQETGSSFLSKAQFIRNGEFDEITGYEIRFEDQMDPEIVKSMSIKETDFTVKEQLITYYESNQLLPDEAFSNIGLAPRHFVDTTKWSLINIAIYMGFATIATIFVFKYEKRRMGRGKPTSGLMKDIERVKSKK